MVSLARSLASLTRYANNNRIAPHHVRALSPPSSSPRPNSQPIHCYPYSTLTKVPTCDDYRTIKPISHVNNYVIQRRFRKKKGKGARSDDDDEEEDDDDDLAEENPLLVDDLLDSQNDGSQSMKLDVNSLRLDGVCKAAFGMTRAKVEEAFYRGDIYLNGERPSKKSAQLSLNDEIDMIKGVNVENGKLVDIRRAIITSLPDKQTETGRVKIGIKRWMDLTMERPGTEKLE